MITLALYNKMLEDKVADLNGDESDPKRNFYWEEAPLQENGNPARGVWLVTRAGNISNSRKGLNLRTTVDFYVAMKDKVKTELIHREIRQWIIRNQCFCELSGSHRNITYHFENVRIRPAETPQNDGATENGLIVKVASATLVYDEVNNN